MDQVQAVKEYLQKHDAFANMLGIRLLEVRRGFAAAEMKIEAHHLNSINTVHGGAIFTLADLVFAAASNAYGLISVGIEMNISCVKAGREGILRAEAFEVSRGPRIAAYNVIIQNDEGDTIAAFRGLAYIKKDAYPPA